MKRPRFRFVFEALDHPDGLPVDHRLRALLKHALRSLRLRCVEAVEVKTPDPEDDVPDVPFDEVRS